MSFFKKISFVSAALFLLACTDYVEEIDAQIEEYKAHDLARTESSIPTADIKVDPEDVIEGTFKDTRDSQEYKTVTIGTQTWMAENLNYKVADSYCYNDDSSNCSKYGRLYTWAAAMDSSGSWDKNGKGCGYGKICAPTYPVMGVCPGGWHLPSKGEWEALRVAVCGHSSECLGSALKSKKDWKNDDGGDDTHGLALLPAGAKTINGKYYYLGTEAFFWLSTEENSTYATNVYASTRWEGGGGSTEKNYAISVRCVKD